MALALGALPYPTPPPAQNPLAVQLFMRNAFWSQVNIDDLRAQFGEAFGDICQQNDDFFENVEIVLETAPGGAAWAAMASKKDKSEPDGASAPPLDSSDLNWTLTIYRDRNWANNGQYAMSRPGFSMGSLVDTVIHELLHKCLGHDEMLLLGNGWMAGLDPAGNSRTDSYCDHFLIYRITQAMSCRFVIHLGSEFQQPFDFSSIGPNHPGWETLEQIKGLCNSMKEARERWANQPDDLRQAMSCLCNDQVRARWEAMSTGQFPTDGCNCGITLTTPDNVDEPWPNGPTLPSKPDADVCGQGTRQVPHHPAIMEPWPPPLGDDYGPEFFFPICPICALLGIF